MNTTVKLAVAGLVLLLSGCADPLLPGFSYTNQEGYQVSVGTEPAPAVPDKPIRLVVDVRRIDAEKTPNPTAVVFLLNSSAGGDLEVPLELESGTRWVATQVFPVEGSYAYTVEIRNDSFTETVGGSLPVACPTDSPLGGSCCDASNCANGALCIVATCSEGRLGLDEFCLVGADCETGECVDNVCLPEPTCDDGRKNAEETDVDCGGGTCQPCAEAQACLGAEDCNTAVCEEGVCGPPVGWPIGKGNGSPDSVTLTPILSSELAAPSDLQFSPDDPTELWVVNKATDHITVILNPGDPGQQVSTFYDFSRHFLEKVVSLSFSDDSTFATCGESRNGYDGFAPPNDFMGPALWPGTRAEFYQYGPDAANVHLDMLHSSPWCVGVEAHGNGSKYFVFNGLNGVLDYYDFGVPHPDKKYGGEDHTDGKKRRYSEVQLKRVANVTGHMHFDPATQWLYIADTGNQRVVRVKVDGAGPIGMLPSFPMDGVLWEYQGVTQEDFVSANTNILQRPAGIVLHDGLLYVSDAMNGNLHAFNETGGLVRSLETGLGANALAGITFGPDGLLYLVDRKSNKLLRIDP